MTKLPSEMILGYAGTITSARVAPRVRWSSEGNTVVVTVLPSPLWRPVLLELLLLVGLWFTAFCVLLVIAFAGADRQVLVFLLLVSGAGILVSGIRTGLRLWRLWYRAEPSVIRASPDRLEVTPPQWMGKRRQAWPRERIVELDCQLSGIARGLQEFLRLAVSTSEGALETVRIPWPPATGIYDLEVSLKDTLKLSAKKG